MCLRSIGKICKAVSKVENNEFANSLIDTTTQDGGTRKRSNDQSFLEHYQKEEEHELKKL